LPKYTVLIIGFIFSSWSVRSTPAGFNRFPADEIKFPVAISITPSFSIVALLVALLVALPVAWLVASLMVFAALFMALCAVLLVALSIALLVA
jgi:hypothetical protein